MLEERVGRRTAELQAALREQATRDPLTGLYNCRYLGETLGRELILAERNGQPVSLLWVISITLRQSTIVMVISPVTRRYGSSAI